MDDPSFGTLLRQRRKQLDLTQEELAELVNCSLSTVQKYETDALRPGKSTIARLAEKLAIPHTERALFAKIARAPLPQRPHKRRTAAQRFIPTNSNVDRQSAHQHQRQAHAQAIALMAERYEREQNAPVAESWFERFDLEMENIRAAIDWSLDHDGGVVAGRIIVALKTYWQYRRVKDHS